MIQNSKNIDVFESEKVDKCPGAICLYFTWFPGFKWYCKKHNKEIQGVGCRGADFVDRFEKVLKIADNCGL